MASIRFCRRGLSPETRRQTRRRSCCWRAPAKLMLYIMAASDYEQELDKLRKECEQLRAENPLLKQALATNDGQAVVASPDHNGDDRAPAVTAASAAEAKIALFRSLFRGREDVYAVRWQRSDGRSGYSPTAQRDWKAYLASSAADRKEVDRKTRTLLPLTDHVIRQHLQGSITIGIYPLLTDETCWFLAVDFDKAGWQDDVTAFAAVCREKGVPAAIERSRSGAGAHVWVFFERPLPATMARRLGCARLTRTMEQRHEIGLDSYDRLFPNQDTMPKGGFGNLIALPLQKGPRESGNPVFIGEDFTPYSDQWALLARAKRMQIHAVEAIVAEATQSGAVVGVRLSRSDDDEPDPWTLPPSGRRPESPITEPLPTSVNVVRANLLFVEKAGLPSPLVNRILRLAAFQNPDFYKAQAMRLSTFGKPRVISCGEELSSHIALPRGSLDELAALLKSHSIAPRLKDERSDGTPIELEFAGELRPTQKEAASAILSDDCGVLSAPTGFGKTAVAAYVVAARRVNTLVLVHRRQLLDQWRERLAMFLNLQPSSIGQIGGGKSAPTKHLDVAVVQSLYVKKQVNDLVEEYGQVIVDECHHVSAFSFEQVMRQVKARYVLGMTATPMRKDGHHPIITMQCGPIRFNLSTRSMAAAAPFEHRVLPKVTRFNLGSDGAEAKIHEIYAALIEDADRNEIIARDLVSAVRAGRSSLLLSSRTKHLDLLKCLIDGKVPNIFVLKGGMGRKQRRAVDEALTAVSPDEPRVILATGSYIGEGFDDARLDTLFLATPISWRGTLQQYVGRLHRLHDGKQVVEVYDYVDARVPMLARMYERRIKGYRAMGYSLADAPSEAASRRHFAPANGESTR